MKRAVLAYSGGLDTSVTIRWLSERGVVEGGMIPKLESAVRALEGGVARVHLLDGRVEHALVLELFTPEGIGTMVTRPDRARNAVPSPAEVSV